jgi:hypothetical protein
MISTSRIYRAEAIQHLLVLAFPASEIRSKSGIKESPGFNETIPEELSGNKVQYSIAPSGGANRAEVTIDYGLNQGEIYVSWG